MTFPDPFAFEYAHGWVLYFLAALPLLAIYELWHQRRRRSAFRFPGTAFMAKIGRGWRVYLQPAPAVLRLLALGLLIVALARPQTHFEHIERTEEGIDIFVALDMSGSMEAVDLLGWQVERMKGTSDWPPKNRFEVATGVLKDFVKTRPHDRIGMVIFGVDAFLEFPLTLDKTTILNILDRRQLGDIDRNGTAIGNAIARGVAGLRRSKAKSRILVLITDGDRRGGDVSPRRAAILAKDYGIKVYPILIGREDGIPPLVPNDDEWTSYRPVEFMTDPQLLKELATLTNGHYSRAGSEEALHEILSGLPTTKNTSRKWTHSEDHYHHYLFWVMLLLSAGLIIKHGIVRKFP